ncbi:MAG TPA: aldehyde dehydrogenase family protein [Mycobacteriales bacterium]|nr:aldehyde dehydrogenase family protein [Mycobacteriales bacterium]
MRDCELFIGGEWVPGESGRTFDSINPATGEPIARLQEGSPSDVDRAVAAAGAAARDYGRMPVFERAALCEAVADVLERRASEVASVLSAEQGKPLLAEAPGEIATAVAGFRGAAAHITHLEGATMPAADPAKRVLTFRQPRGVYAVVTPWNFPINIPTEYLAPALATGNTVVWVPAPTTSLCAVVLAEIFAEAGVPPGVVNLVTGPGSVVGDAAVAHPGTQAVGFTGSTATGHTIAARAAGKPLLLELGGNGPTIVFADADLPTAARAIARGAFFNAGQVCAASEVVFAERSIQPELARLLVAEAEAVRLGLPDHRDTTMGPLNNPGVAAKMDRHLADATKRRARVLAGGGRAPGFATDLFYQPTVLADVPPDAVLVEEESFGPLAPIVPFDSEDEVLRLADAPQFGLVSSVWTASAGRAFRAAETLRTGIVNVNESTSYWEIHIPFGGGSGTGSGVGRLGGMHTLREMTDLKTITLDITRF